MTNLGANFQTSVPAIHHKSSWLFVPADRKDRFVKAVNSGAGVVIIDLEDSVNDAQKQVGRANILAYDKECATPFWVRINATDTPHYAQDVALLAQCRQVAGIVVPKATCADSLTQVAQLALPMLIAIETVDGIANVNALAKVRGVCAITFGVLDLARAMGFVPDSDGGRVMLDYLRCQILLASRLAQVVAIESIFANFQDTAGFLNNAKRAFEMGFVAQLCIHPNQVALANLAYQPSDEHIAFANLVLDKHTKTGDIAFAINGIMVDLPVIDWAKNLLSRIHQ